MTDDQEFQTFPVMQGIPALVKRPEGFLVPPNGDAQTVAIGASADPGRAGHGLFYIGIQQGGELLVAILPEESLPDLADMLRHAALQIESGNYEQPHVGAAQ